MLLDMIMQKQPLSRTQLAEMTDLSPASITRIVNTLTACQLVKEEGIIDQSGRGRKARLLYTCDDGLYAVGVHIELDKLMISLNDFQRNCLYMDEAPFASDQPIRPAHLAQLAKSLYQRIDRSLLADWSRVRAVGISVPGVVDSERGIVIKSNQLCWENADLRTPFIEALNLPIWIENDAKACLLGEQARMNIPRQEDTVYLMVGTGVGIAVLSNGKVVRGYRNMAGEVEQLNLMTGLHSADVLETHLVEHSILHSAQSAMPSIRNLDDLMIAYRQNAGFAHILVDDILQYLRLLISMVDCFYDPKQIVLGGAIISKMQEAFQPIFADPRLSIGADCATSCVVGASVGAFDLALDTLLSEQENGKGA